MLFKMTVEGPKTAMRAFEINNGEAVEAEYSENSFADDWSFTLYLVRVSLSL